MVDKISMETQRLTELDEFYDLVFDRPKTLQEQIQDMLAPAVGKLHDGSLSPILASIIRKLVPMTLAQDIVEVQPMLRRKLPKRLHYDRRES
jgi:hypothetical protein